MSAELELVQSQLEPLRERLKVLDEQLAEWQRQIDSGKNFYHHNARSSALVERASLVRDIEALELRERNIADRIRDADEERERQRLVLLEERQRADKERAEALERAEVEKTAAVEAAIARTKEEDRSFWFRRFHTSLALAHGAGFASVASKLFDSAVTASTAAGAFYPMAAFAIGMGLAGLIPIALFRDAQRPAWALAITSALLFVVALVAAVVAVGLKAEMVWFWQAT